MIKRYFKHAYVKKSAICSVSQTPETLKTANLATTDMYGIGQGSDFRCPSNGQHIKKRTTEVRCGHLSTYSTHNVSIRVSGNQLSC